MDTPPEFSLFDKAATAVGLLMGALWTMLRNQIARLQEKNEKQDEVIKEINDMLRSGYSTRNEMEARFDRIYNKLDQIENKLDRKADR